MTHVNAIAGIYTRVSSTEQIDNTSLETQESVCRAWCARHGYEVSKVFSDRGESAKTANRPNFLALVEWARKIKPAVVLAYRIDRWARNSDDFAIYRTRLASYGVQMLSATENITDDPTGRAMASLLAVFANLDNDCRAQRASTGMAATIRRGGYVTLAPRGYRNVRKNGIPSLEIVEPEATVVRDIILSVVDGSYDPASAAKSLGIQQNHVGEMIRRPVWAGLSRCGGEFVQGSWEPLVPRQAWEEAVRILERPARRVCPDSFPLRGILSCGCGRSLTASVSTGRSGSKHAYYHCHGCRARHRKQDLEKKVDDWIRFQTLRTSPVLRKVSESVSHYAREAEKAISGRRDAALARADIISSQIRRLQDYALKGIIPEDEFAERNAHLRSEREKAMAEANQQDTSSTTASAIVDACVALLNDVPKILLFSNPKIRKALFDVLCGSTIIVERDGTCRTAKNTSVFGLLSNVQTPENEVAYLTGVEPVTF